MKNSCYEQKRIAGNMIKLYLGVVSLPQKPAVSSVWARSCTAEIW